MIKKVRGWSLVAVLWLAVLGVGIVAADPTPACRNLAAWFATRPAELNTQSLSALGECVMQEIQARGQSQETPQPPQAQGDSSSSEGPPPEAPGWGPWEAPAPWKDDAAKTTPWDSYDK